MLGDGGASAVLCLLLHDAHVHGVSEAVSWLIVNTSVFVCVCVCVCVFVCPVA